MSTKIRAEYIPSKKVALTHLDSGVSLITSAPKDNSGDGSSFSPTDLVGASMSSCMITIMAIWAEKNGVDISGCWAEVDKQMSSTPRRISTLKVEIHLPNQLSTDHRDRLEQAARGCPVHHSLHPDIKVDLSFWYDVQAR